MFRVEDRIKRDSVGIDGISIHSFCTEHTENSKATFSLLSPGAIFDLLICVLVKSSEHQHALRTQHYVDCATYIAHNSQKELDTALAHARKVARERDKGIDRILKEYDVDAIIGPAESAVSTMACASGE